MKVTAAQHAALTAISDQWQNDTAHTILGTDLEIVEEDTLETGSYIGLWVGPGAGENPGRMYLGVELDGHVHS